MAANAAVIASMRETLGSVSSATASSANPQLASAGALSQFRVAASPMPADAASNAATFLAPDHEHRFSPSLSMANAANAQAAK